MEQNNDAASDDGFQLVTSRKRRGRDEPDPRLIVHGKRTRIETERIRAIKQAIPKGTSNSHKPACNQFKVLDHQNDTDDNGDEVDTDSVEEDEEASDSDTSHNATASQESSETRSETEDDDLRRKTAPVRVSSKGKGRRTKIAERKKLPVVKDRNGQSVQSSPIVVEEDDNNNDDDEVVEVPAPKERKEAKTTKLIYAFFKRIPESEVFRKGPIGTRYYQCYHGNESIQRITPGMKHSTTGLINHLRAKFPVVFGFYEYLQSKGPQYILTPDDIAIAKGQKMLSNDQIKRLTNASASLEAAFARQAEAKQEPWDRSKLELKIAEWMVADDIPFAEVEKPYFQMLMQYLHRTPGLRIPSADTMQRRVLKMKDDAVHELQKIIENLTSKVSLSLDAWTSSNGYSFLAIVMHYVSNDWKQEEVLIDFREIIGAHSGENIAEVVWSTMETYGLRRKVMAIVSDNASNNDTMMEALEEKSKQHGVEFRAKDTRCRCMPHTVHLAAMKLLDAIGASRGTMPNSSYQDNCIPPNEEQDVSRDDLSEDDEDRRLEDTHNLISAIGKLRKIIRAVRSSSQRRKAWLNEVQISLKQADKETKEIALMLILDVKTRWSSTQKMMRRAIRYKSVIDDFVGKNRDLRKFELVEGDWRAIEVVEKWLRCFADATTQMSMTKQSTLSSIHAVFRGLQDEVRKFIKELPSGAPAELRDGLLSAHHKLSDYFYKFDSSPFYVWATLLDPRISYSGMRDDITRDSIDGQENLEHIDRCKESLRLHFNKHYANVLSLSKTPLTMPAVNHTNGSPQRFNFTSRYYSTQADQTCDEEFDEYFNMKRTKDWESGDPVIWWEAHKAQFPNLSRLARDLLSIPGSAVAVERIFSGGWDTISLRRASLKADTICTLMIVKQWLRKQL